MRTAAIAAALLCACGPDLEEPGALTAAPTTPIGRDIACLGCEEDEEPLPPAQCRVDADCAPGSRCLAGSCACGGTVRSAARVDRPPPNVMIVFDRSGSMAGTKWTSAVSAARTLVTTYGDRVRFGLSLFAQEPRRSCAQSRPLVEVGPGTAATIMSRIDATRPDGGTPMAEALWPLVGRASLQDATRDNYVLLVTDGMPTCADPVPAVRALRNQPVPVRTFVVGFGTGVDPRGLARMAEEGGTARAGAPAYYQADDAASLRASFDAIAQAVIQQPLGCEYRLDAPADPERLFVWVDGRELPPVSADGAWAYEGDGVLQFYGPVCDRMTRGEVTDVKIVEGCPIR